MVRFLAHPVFYPTDNNDNYRVFHKIRNPLGLFSIPYENDQICTKILVNVAK